MNNESRNSGRGVGSRISEETHLKPKPMIEMGDRPILSHIMKGYSHYGINRFKEADSGLPVAEVLRSHGISSRKYIP